MKAPHSRGPATVAAMGRLGRFKNGSAFRRYTGLTPRASETGASDNKGQPMSKAGPSLLRDQPVCSANTARQIDPELARIYYVQMCQRPLGIPRGRPMEFPRDGHENSPRTAMSFPGPSAGERHHPLARGGVDEAHRFALGDDDMGVVQEPVDEG
jgi:hypothetical protein